MLLNTFIFFFFQAAVQNLVTKVTTVLDNLIVTPDAAELVSIVGLYFNVVNVGRFVESKGPRITSFKLSEFCFLYRV